MSLSGFCLWFQHYQRLTCYNKIHMRPIGTNSPRLYLCVCVCVSAEVQVPGWGDAPLGAQSSTSGSREKCRDASHEWQEPCCHGGHTRLHTTHTYLSCQGRTHTHTHTHIYVHCWLIRNTSTTAHSTLCCQHLRMSLLLCENKHTLPSKGEHIIIPQPVGRNYMFTTVVYIQHEVIFDLIFKYIVSNSAVELHPEIFHIFTADQKHF